MRHARFYLSPGSSTLTEQQKLCAIQCKFQQKLRSWLANEVLEDTARALEKLRGGGRSDLILSRPRDQPDQRVDQHWCRRTLRALSAEQTSLAIANAQALRSSLLEALWRPIPSLLAASRPSEATRPGRRQHRPQARAQKAKSR
eukprot:948531-Pleurochrysis_carterae.AAC.1